MLSLVIPCYNESDRLAIMVDGLTEMFASWGRFECIVVDDGSTDNTWKLLMDLADELPSGIEYRPIKLEQNRGKGGALAAGVELAQGDHILTLDADMSARPTSLFDWLKELGVDRFPDNQILIANRRHGQSRISALKYREVLGIIFNKLIAVATGLKISDTQCGFKLYPHEMGKFLFNRLEDYGWAHDIEILYTAKYENMSIVSMPVVWSHVDGEKIDVVTDGFKMLRAIPKITRRVKRRYASIV